ncbi:type IV secretory system conjugative DNA transfer family protein [Lentzea sp. NPDC051838]|uniref:type IV secretory system conjugative DNA transfer family protein n=1 Tax=Lentzea sp. NPDC051838 TaxID=3154849 RepID=UPI00342B6E82
MAGTPQPATRQGLTWYRLHLPSGLDVVDVMAFLRPLAHRPRLGLTNRTPVVTLEVWSHGGTLTWLVGVDPQLRSLPGQLNAQLPTLVLTRENAPRRTTPLLTADLRITGVSEPLRIDMASAVSEGLVNALQNLKPRESAVVQWTVGPAQPRRSRPQRKNLPQLLGFGSALEPQINDQQHWRKKTAEPLFAVRGRIGAHTDHPAHARTLIHLVAQALALASASHTEVRSTPPSRRGAVSLLAPRTNRRWTGVVNAAELATLIGWPHGNLLGFGASPNPAPPQLLNQEAPGAHRPDTRMLGHSLHPADDQQLVALPVETALRHLHVTGVTGSGKSTQLASFIRADMAAGRSVLLIEPRGDLVNDVLLGVPAGRRDDVVVIEPGIGREVVGINPLAGAAEDAELRADQVLHLFREVFGHAGIGPRSNDILLHALTALARCSTGTLADLPVLLTNSTFRRRLLGEVTDPLVLAPFFAWYDGISDAERAQVIAPVLNKVRGFLSRTNLRRLLGQATPRFQLEELFTHRRIVLVNLNTGVIGAEAASLIGALLLTQLWQATLRRAQLPPAERHPVMVVVDEVQDYLKLPVDIGNMLAQARALGVGITAAHQHLGQLTPNLRAAFFANARSRMVFHPSTEDSRALAGVLGGGVTAAQLEHLGRFEACCRLVVDNTMTAPFTVRTTGLGASLSNPVDLRTASRQRYGVNGDDLDATLTTRWYYNGSRPHGPIGITRRAA